MSHKRQSLCRNLSNGLLEDIDGLTPLDEMPLVKNHSRDGVDALLKVEALALADLCGVFVRDKHL